MIVGRFGNTTGRPYVSGRLFLPRLHLSSDLSFLVDTGADSSALMPADAIKMGVDYKQLFDRTTIGGFSGSSVCYREPALLAFVEHKRHLIRYYVLKVVIPSAKPALMHTPSILGRDVLDKWHIKYDPSRDNLTFTVRSADSTDRVR